MKMSDKTKNMCSVAFTFVSSFAVSFIVICALCMIVMRFSGVEFFTVESSSMEPKYPKDALVFVKKCEPAQLSRGDVITYVLNRDGVLVTHRIISVDKANEAFTTKGDANDSEDPNPVLWSNVVGKVVFGIPKVGGVFRVLTQPSAQPFLIAAVVLLGLISVIGDLREKYKKKHSESPK